MNQKPRLYFGTLIVFRIHSKMKMSIPIIKRAPLSVNGEKLYPGFVYQKKNITHLYVIVPVKNRFEKHFKKKERPISDILNNIHYF